MPLANDSERIAIVGRTGSGKTVAGLWELSERSYTEKPWVIVDYKREELVAAIDPIELRLDETPTKPGLYVIRPLPNVDDEKVTDFLWRIWQHENIGLFVDEGYALPHRGAFVSLQTQGRSKRTPVITLSQRPVLLPMFVWSEASKFLVFDLTMQGDRERVAEYVPLQKQWVRGDFVLPKHFSYFYDVAQRDLRLLSPVPEPAVILQTFEDRRPKKRKRL